MDGREAFQLDEIGQEYNDIVGKKVVPPLLSSAPAWHHRLSVFGR